MMKDKKGLPERSSVLCARINDGNVDPVDVRGGAGTIAKCRGFTNPNANRPRRKLPKRLSSPSKSLREPIEIADDPRDVEESYRSLDTTADSTRLESRLAHLVSFGGLLMAIFV